VYVEGHEDSENEPDMWGDQGVVGKEMWEAGVGTSEVPNKGQGLRPGESKVASELRLDDKGKGKEKEVVNEETLQEEQEQQDM